jgi:hypothetical protein
LIFQESLPKLVTGEIDLGSMPSIALQALEQGLDTPSLRILAGLREDENEFVLRRYLENTLRELSIELPNKRQATIMVALTIAEDIFEERQPIVEGVENIRRTIDTYPFHLETIHRRYDSINFDKVYILLLNAESYRDSGSLDAALEQELLMELRIWSMQMRNN